MALVSAMYSDYLSWALASLVEIVALEGKFTLRCRIEFQASVVRAGDVMGLVEDVQSTA